MITYIQAVILGLFQGVTELFPVSSLGHSILISYLLRWHNVVDGSSQKGSNFLLFLVFVHVATAIALFIYYRKTWYRIIGALLKSLTTRSTEDKDAKLGWLLIFATIPAAIVGFIFESLLQKQFAKPLTAIVFIFLNGLMLLYGDYYINNKTKNRLYKQHGSKESHISDAINFKRAAVIGVTQIGALFAGISRSGITMIGGVISGLKRDEAAEFSFLLATPVILGAGLYKLPDAISSKTAGMHGQMLVGALCAGIAAYFSVRFLDQYFKKSSYRPFGIYCIALALIMLAIGFSRGLV
jgi:undecaprenyl-diphosphatase